MLPPKPVNPKPILMTIVQRTSDSSETSTEMCYLAIVIITAIIIIIITAITIIIIIIIKDTHNAFLF